MWQVNTDKVFIRTYTTSLAMEPDVSEDVLNQQHYNLCMRFNLSHHNNYKAYSRIGVIRGIRMVFTTIVVYA